MYPYETYLYVIQIHFGYITDMNKYTMETQQIQYQCNKILFSCIFCIHVVFVLYLCCIQHKSTFCIYCISKKEVKHQTTDRGGLQTAPASTAGLFHLNFESPPPRPRPQRPVAASLSSTRTASTHPRTPSYPS